MNWLLPIIHATSLSVRSPNIEPNPFDYQIQFSIQKSDYFYVADVGSVNLGLNILMRSIGHKKNWVTFQ